MPFTLVGFDEARATAVTTLTKVNAVPDDHIATEAGDVIVPSLNRIIGYFFCHSTGTAKGNITGGRLESPSLRRLFPIDAAVLSNGLYGIHTHTENLAASYTQNATTAEAVAVAESLEMFPQNPIPLDVNEHLEAFMTNYAVTGARGLVGVWLSDGAISPVTGEMRTIKATTTFTPTANEWSSGDLTFVTTLPTGRYRMVGARVISDNTVGLFRFIFIGGIWRPGGVIQNKIDMPTIRPFRKGQLGVWGEFDQLTPPKLEILEIASVANPDVYLDLIKVA